MKKRFLSILMAVVLLSSSVPLPVLASESQETSEAGTKDAEVLYEMSANYMVTIPKTIALSSDNTSTYSVKVEGDIPSGERVYVSPIDGVSTEDGFNFYMKNQSPFSTKDDVLANITHSKFYWNYLEAIDAVESIDNSIVAAEMSAGTWKGNFSFEICMKSFNIIDVSAKDSDGNDLNASAEAIIGEEKENLLDQLVESGLVDSAEDVDALIDVKSDNFDDLADATFDVSNIAQEGDKIVILHYDETTKAWEFIGEDTVEDGTIEGDFTSFSPVAFVKVKDDGTYEHTHIDTDNDGVCNICNESLVAGLYDDNGVMLCSWDESGINSSASNSSSVIRSSYPTTAKLVLPNDLVPGISAFEYCDTVKTLVIPSGFNLVTAGQSCFAHMINLETVYLSDGITKLGAGTFRHCEKLKNIRIPSSLKDFGLESLWGTQWMTDRVAENPLVIVNDVLVYTEGLSGNVVIPDGVEAISTYAFFNYQPKSIQTITIPDSVTKINNCAFNFGRYIDDNLEYLVVPDNIKEIGGGILLDDVFHDVKCLVYSGDIENTTEYPNWGATYLCKAIENGFIFEDAAKTKLVRYVGTDTNITIPSSTKTIGESAFEGLTSLESVVIPNGVASIGSNAFKGCTSLESVTIPNSVTTIGDYAFNECTSLSSVEMSNTITTIGDYAFAYCNLSSIEIPNSVSKIGEYAFTSNELLTEIYVPVTATYIGSNIIDSGNIYYGGTTEQWASATCDSEYSWWLITVWFNYSSMPSQGTGTESDPYRLTVTYENSNMLIENISYEYEDGFDDSGFPMQYTNAVIPSKFEYEGKWYKVVALENVVMYGDYLNDLVISEGIESISPWAIGGCTISNSITIPSTVSIINPIVEDLPNVYFNHTTAPIFIEDCFPIYSSYPSERNFYFKNSTVADAFDIDKCCPNYSEVEEPGVIINKIVE